MTNNIQFRDFKLNPDTIAPQIYKGFNRLISSNGILINEDVKLELEDFLKLYEDFLGLSNKKSFFRIDAYFDENRLYILDVNASFVDGWGNALNFARSVGERTGDILEGYFPPNFFLLEEEYRPEFELAIQELSIKTGEYFQEGSDINSGGDFYIYGSTKEISSNIFPYNGIENDDKTNLARFSKKWNGNLVKIPIFIGSDDESDFGKIPEDVVLKISSKNDIQNGRNKVFIGKSSLGKKGRVLWEEGKLLAQEKILSLKNEKGENTQAIILTAGVKVIAGYVQNSTRSIINDNSIQSPLVIK